MAKKPVVDAKPDDSDPGIESLDTVLSRINTASCRPVSQQTVKQCLKQGNQCYWFKQTITTYECCDAGNCWKITVYGPMLKGGKCECSSRTAQSMKSSPDCGCH